MRLHLRLLATLSCLLLITGASTSLAAGADTDASAQEQARRQRVRDYKAGSGIKLLSGDWGETRFRLSGYVRYLNQGGLDESYTDSFGETHELDLRQDIQLNKYNLYFFGWFMDPRFRYLAYVWTSNASQGLGAQVVVAGNLQFRFNPHIALGAGITGLPGTRTVEGNWPRWLPVDNRLIADEYFRPSYTSGVWASGIVTEGLKYTVMLGNNLSQLGIDAGQLDDTMDTWSGVLAWMPTTGEFGTASGFGDFEHHAHAATRVGLHYTRSSEDWQTQPGTEAPENSQIRISDGSVVFTPGLFGPGIFIRDLTYQMFAVDAGVKYRGLALETEFYWRLVDNFGGDGIDQLTFDELTDNGLQVLASAMLKPRAWQVYAGYSTIFGEYGDPWDARLGVSWYPYLNEAFRINVEAIHVDGSPVGGLTLPLLVGANGNVFTTNFEINF